MARKHKDATPALAPEAARGISRRGWKVIGGGAGLLAAGYSVLCFTDPRGQNWASVLAPFLILGGYAVIGIGILTPDPEEIRDQRTEISKVVADL